MTEQLPKKKAPAYTWFPGDEAADELQARLSLEAYGLFKRLYDHAWLNDGLPLEPGDIFDLPASAKARTRAKFDQLWMTVAPLFPPDGNGRRRNPSQERKRSEWRDMSTTNRDNAHRGWEKRRNAPALPSHPSRSAVALPPHCDPDAEPEVSASGSQCLLSLSLDPDRDQDQKDHRATPRRALVRMTLTIHDVTPQLYAFVHRCLEHGAPFVDAHGPVVGEIVEAVKLLLSRPNDRGGLGATYRDARDVYRVVEGALGQLDRLAHAERRWAGQDARERTAFRKLGRLGGRRR